MFLKYAFKILTIIRIPNLSEFFYTASVVVGIIGIFAFLI
jgi:hypothetical protein